MKLTLEQALTVIAQLSIDESATVYPGTDGYEVYDDCSYNPYVEWDEATGQPLLDEQPREEYPGHVDDSGIMHPSEFFDNAEQIENFLPTAVEALKEGTSVTFAYSVVEAPNPDDEPIGWILIAREAATL